MLKKRSKLKHYIKWVCLYIPILSRVMQTRNTNAPLSVKGIIMHALDFRRVKPYWPVHPSSKIANPKNITIGVNCAPGNSLGCYIQAIGKMTIGDHTIIAPNVGIITANHSIHNHQLHDVGEVQIGSYCWIGMNSTILPNVVLGNHTVVAAGAVVTKSFAEGYVVLGGNPARVIKRIEPDKCEKFENKYEYIGYIKKKSFKKFQNKYLNK